MLRIQFILSLFLLICFTACQNDAVAEKTQDVVEDSTQKAKEVIEEVAEEVKELQDKTESTSKLQLKEFYVEEDKSEVENESKDSRNKKSEKVEEKKAIASAPTAKTKTKKYPKMKFTNDTFAFGVIKPGDVIEHKFEFTNTGTADLIITDAKATCGCTQPSFPFVPIPPGEKGYIGVKYDSTGKLGTQKPTVTLTTNGSPKTRKVFLEGVVISKLSKN